MKIRNLQDNGPNCVAWRWTFEIDFEDGVTPVKNYATNAHGEGLFDCDNDYQQLKGTGQFSLQGMTLHQARGYILSTWFIP